MLSWIAPVLAVSTVLLLAGCSSPGTSLSTNTANPAKPAGKAGGCGLVTAEQVSSVSGVTFGTGASVGPVKVTPTRNAPVTDHESCSYGTGSANVDYFLNTLQPAAPPYEAQAWKDDKIEDPAASDVTVDGLPGLSMPEGPVDQVIFYKGQVLVNVTAAGVKTGTALAVATLIAKQL